MDFIIRDNKTDGYIMIRFIGDNQVVVSSDSKTKPSAIKYIMSNKISRILLNKLFNSLTIYEYGV